MPKLSYVARALRPMVDQPIDALGPVSPYQMRLREKAQGIGSTAKTTEEQDKAGTLIDEINHRRAMLALNRHR